MGSNSEAIQGLTSQRNELTKQFLVYDAEDRVETIYTAPYLAVTGTGCTRVDYAFRSPTSTQVEKMRETNDVWSAAYDI